MLNGQGRTKKVLISCEVPTNDEYMSEPDMVNPCSKITSAVGCVLVGLTNNTGSALARNVSTSRNSTSTASALRRLAASRLRILAHWIIEYIVL